MTTKTPRHRSRQIIDFAEQDVVQTYYAGGTTFTKGTETTSDGVDNMDDFVVSDYHKRIAAGEIINNPCLYDSSTHVTVGDGYIDFHPNPSYHYDITGPISAYLERTGTIDLNTVATDVTEDEAGAKLRAIANIDSTPYAFGEDVLELRETVRFLRNPVAELHKLSIAFRKSYLRVRSRRGLDYLVKKDKLSRYDMKRLLDAHASVFLQYQFALSPLVRSTIDALDAYQSKPPIMPERLTSRGFFEDEDTQTVVNQSGLNNHTYNASRTERMDGKASILYTVTNPVHDWRYRLGFRVKDIPTTLWQVMPLSFMVDRFIDVSSFSKGVMNLIDPQVRILAGSYRTKWERSTNYKLTGRNVSGFTLHSSDEHIINEFRYDRSIWNPSVSDTIPNLTLGRVIDSATKIAELMALTTSNITRLLT